MMKRRRILKWIGRGIVIIVVLVIAGTIYETLAETHDMKTYPPPGRLVDIGGYRLHIHCTGKGSPTVVIESGWGDTSGTWGWVQPEVAKSTRVCTYDRAGMGWSEISPEPRTYREFAKELHTLLTKDGEPGPYVLVGHSLGAYTVRIYALDYPKEVVGIVFVDPQNLSVTHTTTFNPAPKPDKNAAGVLMAHIGVIRLLAEPLGAVEKLPAQDKQAYTAYAVAPRSVQTFLDEGTGMSEGVVQTQAVTTLGKLPILVLSRGKDMDPESAASQDRYLKLSTNNRHFVAEQSDHHIMIDQPKAVEDAVTTMLKLVREGKK
jgi:pimeloyl-ACP methyl ester carboxylesterase